MGGGYVGVRYACGMCVCVIWVGDVGICECVKHGVEKWVCEV